MSTKIRTTLLILAFLLLSAALYGKGNNNVAIGSNLMGYLNFATFNGDLGIGISRHWSIHLNGKYNPFNWHTANQYLQNKQLSFACGARYWNWYRFSGWYWGGKVRYCIYNSGGIISPRTEEGDALGGSLEFGYQLLLSRHINMEFGAGIWGGWKKYRHYDAPRCGKLIGQGEKFFIAPDNISISVIYNF